MIRNSDTTKTKAFRRAKDQNQKHDQEQRHEHARGNTRGNMSKTKYNDSEFDKS